MLLQESSEELLEGLAELLVELMDFMAVLTGRNGEEDCLMGEGKLNDMVVEACGGIRGGSELGPWVVALRQRAVAAVGSGCLQLFSQCHSEKSSQSSRDGRGSSIFALCFSATTGIRPCPPASESAATVSK